MAKNKNWMWRGNVAQYDFTVNGERYRGSLKIKKNSGIIDGKTPSERAEAETRNLMVQIEQKHSIETIYQQTQKKLAGISGNVDATFDAVWQVYSDKSMSIAGTNRKKIYAGHLRQFFDWLNLNHKDVKNLSQITTDCAKEFITWLRAQSGAPATKNDKLATLRMIFGIVSSGAGLPINPFAAKEIKKMPLQQVQREIFTPEQIHILFTESSGWMRQLFITALATFQREEDCCLLKKYYIDLASNRVDFPFTYKTGQQISLPMLPLFREIAEEALQDEKNQTEYLFPELAHLYHTNRSRIGKDVKKFLTRLNIDNACIDVPGYSRKVSILDVHSLRHTAAVMAVLSGWHIPMIMKATGHRSLEMVMRYINHISEKQKENYFFQFGQGLPGLQTQNDNDLRKQLADLAYSLPLEEVKRLVQSARPAIASANQVSGQHLLG
jgi:integrase